MKAWLKGGLIGVAVLVILVGLTLPSMIAGYKSGYTQTEYTFPLLLITLPAYLISAFAMVSALILPKGAAIILTYVVWAILSILMWFGIGAAVGAIISVIVGNSRKRKK